MRAISVLTAVSAFAFAAAPAGADTFAARSVDVVDAAAILRVVPEDRSDIAVEATGGPRLAAPQAHVDGDRLVLDGNIHVTGCGGAFGQPVVRVVGVGGVRRADLPVVTLHVPRQFELSTHGAVFADIGASGGGHFVSNGCGDSRIGPVTGDLALEMHGSGDVDLASVSGALHAALQGSGDLRGRNAGSAQLALTGSGDVSLDTVGAGPLDASLVGSGDVRIGAVNGGAVALRLAGSGDLRVDSGAASRLDADLAGSGDMSFGGRVGVLAARVGGSGDIHVASADHIDSMHKGGSGDITIGN